MSELIPTGITYGVGRQAINSLVSGTSTFNQSSAVSLSGGTLSGGTIYSGVTNLSNLFAHISNASPFSGNSITGAILPISGSNIASGLFSFVTNKNNTASGNFSHAEGSNTTAFGTISHSEGNQTKAIGNNSHAEGFQTTTYSLHSHAEGLGSKTSGTYSYAAHAEGLYTTASAVGAHSEGSQTLASADSAHAEGSSTLASGQGSHAGGIASTASSVASFSHGQLNIVNGNYSSIIGGFGNIINVSATGSTILGGSNITANSADTTYTASLVLTNPQPIPSTSGNTGTKGTFSYDTNYLYICYSANSWGRVILDKNF